MASHNLPLLHKYVFHNDDDLQLKMTKLQYRLCVKEVSNVILGRQPDLGLSDIEPTLQPEYSMAATAEAPPPLREEFPSATDEGLSSPDSEDYPRKPQNPDYIYNDSGILMDDSTMNSTQLSNTNGHLDDQLSDTSSMSDPSDYHINRNYDNPHSLENDIRCGQDNTAVTAMDDSAVYANGDITLTEVQEEAIEATHSDRKVEVSFEPVTTDSSQSQQDTSNEPLISDSLNDLVATAPVMPTAPSEEDLEEVKEEVILRSEVRREELEAKLAEERDREKVDFVPGVACTDVETALRILKTRYRLSTTTLKKCIITSVPPVDVKKKRYSAPVFSYDRSRWNLEDVIRRPNEQMPWWSETREPECVVVEKDDRGVLNATIDRKQTEIADLLQKVLDDDRKKSGKADKKEPAPVVSEPQTVAQEPGLEALPEPTEDQPAPEPSQPGKKKKGNIFQRMIRAVRKRLGRNRHRA